jgi:hypothetical protein
LDKKLEGPRPRPPEAVLYALGGQPVRISSMVLLVAYAFYYRNAFSTVI